MLEENVSTSTKRQENNERISEDSIISIIRIVAILEFIGGIVLGFIVWRDSFLNTILCWGSSFIVGLLIYGFADIIDLLQSIDKKMNNK